MVRMGVTLGVVLVAGNTAFCVSGTAPTGTRPRPPIGAAPPLEPLAPAVTPGAETGPPGSGAAVTTPPPAPPPPLALSVIEQELIGLVNRERELRGIDRLVPDARLTAAARAHSREMCDLGYFDHRSPTEGLYTPADRFLRTLSEVGTPAPAHLLLGENIYHISEHNHVYDTAFGHRAIMNSPSHRAAILEPRYTRIGVGAHRDARGELWATEMFLRDTP